MIQIEEEKFLDNPKKALRKLSNANETISISSEGKNYVIIDEKDWNSISETIYLNQIKGYPESIIEASNEPLDIATDVDKLDW